MNGGSPSTAAAPTGGAADSPPARLDAARAREDFPALHQEIHGRPLVYLDNAATTQKPEPVLRAMDEFYRRDNANVHRGIHALSARATEAYEAARVRVARFFGIADPAELVWTRGTTEALNLLAWAWGSQNVGEGDEIVLSVLEHHSNLVPWQLLAARTGARLRFLDIDEQGRLQLDSLDELLTPRTRLVTLGHVSNALGTINPIREIAARAHEVGALVAVDGAQSAPHLDVEVADLGCDFFTFSGHKMCGPTGIGGLWARRELLDAMPPFHGGGDMIDHVDLEGATWARLPHKFEAGTPNVVGAIGMAAAVDYIDALGREAIHRHEQELIEYGLRRLAEIPDLTVHGPRDAAERSAVVSFTLADVHPHDLATIVDAEGVAIRAGHHCAQPLMRRLGVSSTARASFYLYNTSEDVDRLLDALQRARTLFGY